jgi:tetratricopeptide (TPR) repeat protein
MTEPVQDWGIVTRKNRGTTRELQRSARRVLALVASAAALSTLLASPVAHAQAQDQAAARALFEDGRHLLQNGKYEEACRRLEAASKLYASPGILLNLGDCYEKLGRSASAWTEFGEAAAVAARAQRSDQVSEAKRRQAAVEPKLTRLTIRVTGEGSSVTVTRDKTDLSSQAWGEAIPVDPGTHEIHAEAPGHEPWTTTVVVSTAGQTVTVEVPALAASPAPPPGPPVHDGQETAGATLEAVSLETAPARPRAHVVDWVLVGSGVAVGVAGGVLWDLGASHARTASNADTGTEPQYQAAHKDYNSARTLYYLGIGGVAVGAATATAGAILIVGARGASRKPAMGTIQASPWVVPGSGGLQVKGSF